MIIGILGKKGSGKSALASCFGLPVLAFADPLKAAVRDIYGLSEAQLNGDRKEVPTPILGGLTPRTILQRFGTEVARSVHPDTWVWAMERRLQHWDAAIPDVRFANEANMIVWRGGVLVRVVRPGLANVDTHASEVEGDAIAVHFTVLNDGTLAQLGTAADMIRRESTLPARGSGRIWRCAIGCWRT